MFEGSGEALVNVSFIARVIYLVVEITRSYNNGITGRDYRYYGWLGGDGCGSGEVEGRMPVIVLILRGKGC